MQESIQRMSGQVQAMQQEVRELTQLAQQLYQQHNGHFQQMQGNAMQNRSMYQLAGNEESSARLLQYLTDICSEMNQHLRNISQQMGSQQGSMGMQGQQGMGQMSIGGQQGGMSGGMNAGSRQQQKAPEGPIATDTTHFNRANVPGMDQRMTSQLSSPSNNQLPGISDQNQPLNAGGSSLSMGSSARGTQMMAGSQGGQQSAVGTNPLQSQGQGGGASMNQQAPGSEAELKGHSSEYREEPHSTTYPYNRYTT